MTDVVIEKKGHVAIVKIEHMKAMNALSTDMYAQLEEAFDELAKDLDNVYAVVLTGSSTVNKKGRTVNSFVAGADISEMAMSCDIRLASENATFGQPEVGLGITPGCGGTQRLARLVGAGKAKEMLYTARGNYSAQDALDMGLVNYVYPLENLLDEAVKLAEEIAAQAPIAVSLVKEAVNVGQQTDLNSALKFEGNVFAQCFATEDQKYGMAYFLDKNRDKPAKEFKNK